MESVKKLWHLRRWLICWLTPFFWSPILYFQTPEARCGYVVLVMITYWFSEVIPMAITAFIPIVLFPVLHVVSSNDIAKCYINGPIMIFLGSIIAATAVEKSRLHERIALKVILITGTSPQRLFLGFMITTAFLSMWISNLASTALMIPIVNAALEQLTRNIDQPVPPSVSIAIQDGTDGSSTCGNGYSKKDAERLRKGVLLGICYAANIGGTGTLTGTSTNLVLNFQLEEDAAVTFADWSFFNVPGLIILVLITWLFLTIFFLGRPGSSEIQNKSVIARNQKRVYDIIKKQYQQLGPITFHEFAVLTLFSFLLILWFFRAPDFMPGWSKIFTPKEPKFISDSTPTMLVVILFFMIPAQPHNLRHSPALLDWKTTQEKVSWSVLLLLGGGFAMAQGCKISGLSNLLGNHLSVLKTLPVDAIIAIMCLAALIMTELISNIAAVTTLLPVIKQMAHSMNINPLRVMLPVTVSCSYAFMLPFASGTNAIIFEVAKMKNKDMLIPGLIMKVICALVLMVSVSIWAPVVFDFRPPKNITNF